MLYIAWLRRTYKPFFLACLTAFSMHSSHSGNAVSAEILPRQTLHSVSYGFTHIPSPTSRISILAPSVKPYFCLSSIGITIRPSLSTFFIIPSKIKSAPTEASAQKRKPQLSPNKLDTDWVYYYTLHRVRNLHFIKFITIKSIVKKGYKYP